MDFLSKGTVEAVRPDYVIHKFTNVNYKIVKFKSTAPRVVRVDRENFEHYDKKLDPSLSRSRRTVLELALCNNWKYFCTFTIAEANYDRKDLATWHKSFSQWLRDQRKKYLKQGFDFKIDYLLVPEKHKDGSWHMHGLFSDISPLLVSFYRLDRDGWNVPYDLVDQGYYCWFDYWMKYGFCSLAKIQNAEASAVYVSKYVTKTMAADTADVGMRTYYCSQGLRRPMKHGEIYGECSTLDKYLDRDYDFCKVGMTYAVNGLDWSFGMEYMDVPMMEAFKLPDQEEYCPVVDDFVDFSQMTIFE